MITHDLGVVASMCDNVCVMYAGRIVEKAAVENLFGDPRHPYTKGLIKSVPRLDVSAPKRLYSIQGSPPNLIGMPDCCPFSPRCEKAANVCREKYPGETDLGNNHRVSCWLYREER